MHLIGAALDRRDRIDNTQAAILVAMPIKPNLLTLFVDDSAHELHNFARPVRRRMTNGVAHAKRARAAANRGGVKRANRFRICTRRIFSDKHHRQAFTDRERHCFLG